MQPGYIEGGEHGLAGAGGGHHQVVPAVVDRALGRQLVEHFALVGVGPQVEPGDRSAAAGVVLAPGAGEVVVDAGLLVWGGGVGLELALLPVGLKGGLELGQHRRRLQRRQAHVPLQPVHQGRRGEV